MTKYYYVIKALPESSIERIQELLVPPADNPYSVLKNQLMELYDLSDYERATLLMALPQVDGDIRPSMLLDKMKSLTPPGELDKPTSLFWYAFLSRLPRDIRVSCVPFVGVCSVPRERVEYDDEVITAVQDAIHAVKTRAGSLPQLLQLCYYHATFGHRALKCRRPCRWSTAQGNPRGRN